MTTGTGLDPSSLFTGGGLTALLAGAVYVAKIVTDGMKERRESQRPGVTTAAITDAVTANAVLIATVNDMRATITDLDQRLNAAQATIDRLRAEIETLRNKTQP